MKTRICCKCKIEKDVSEFHKDNSQFGGIGYICKECKKEYYKNNSVKRKEYEIKYSLINKDKIAHKKSLYYQKNKEKIATKNKEYRLKHKKENLEYQKQYIKQKRKNDKEFNMLSNLRIRLVHILKGTKKSAPMLKLIGCSLIFLRENIESQFTEGMNWNNYGRIKNVRCWEIDHIYPCSSFDLRNPEEQQICFHWSNLQPLWSKDNRIKWNKT